MSIVYFMLSHHKSWGWILNKIKIGVVEQMSTIINLGCGETQAISNGSQRGDILSSFELLFFPKNSK